MGSPKSLSPVGSPVRSPVRSPGRSPTHQLAQSPTPLPPHSHSSFPSSCAFSHPPSSRERMSPLGSSACSSTCSSCCSSIPAVTSAATSSQDLDYVTRWAAGGEGVEGGGGGGGESRRVTWAVQEEGVGQLSVLEGWVPTIYLRREK